MGCAKISSKFIGHTDAIDRGGGRKSAGIHFQLLGNTSIQHPVARTKKLRWILCMWFTYGEQWLADEGQIVLPRECRKRLDSAV